MSSPDHKRERLVQLASKYKNAVNERTKRWELVDVSKLVGGKLNPDASGRALAEIITEMCDAEERLYDLSIIRMEVRSILNELESADLASIKKEFRKVLEIASDGVSIARMRYDHLQMVLSGIRSINANMRTVSKN